ncbi:MAG: ABC transporter ATP-binding protein [Candidatus Paceibacterota bacterium]|jgi:putative ABC transport system ATP-binding protein
MPHIKIENACVIYNEGSDNQVNALMDVNFEIKPQEYVIIFGPSGCGKSTLLNLIAGLEKPTRGKVIINEQDISQMDANEFARFHCTSIGMVFQAYNLLSSLSVIDNILLPQIFLGNANRKERREKAVKLLEKFGITSQANRIPTELSGGQQQRIGIARALINDQPILLADEPIGNLDSKSAQNVLKIFDDLNKIDKKTFIMVTHNPENLEYADRVFYMKDGRIEHEVVNKKKNKKNTEKGGAKEREFELLMRSFPGLSEAQLHMLMIPFKAKILSEYLLTKTNVDQNQRLEEFIRNRIIGKFKREELRLMLDRSIEDGGVGLDERTATDFSHGVEKVLDNAEIIQSDLSGISSKLGYKDSRLKAKLFVRYFKRAFLDNTTREQINRLEDLLEKRLLNEIGHELFAEKLDLPFKEGGVGLDKRVVRKLIKEFEITLLVKFGIKKE